MDEQPQEEVLQQDFEYAEEDDVPQKKTFATTRKAGYVEDEVDVWVEETIATSTNFLNKYNAAVFALKVLRNQVQEQVDAAVAAALTPALEEQRGTLEGEFENHYRTLEADFATKEQNLRAALEEDYRNQLQNATPAYPAQIEQAPAEYAYVPEEPVFTAPVAGYETPSRRAEEILAVASQEAAEHVTRTLEKVSVIEAEATVEAEEIRTSAIAEAEHVRSTANAEAEHVLSSANAEATGVLTKAYDEANAAIALKNKTIEERNAIFGRLQMFHKSQEDAIDSEKSSIGYTPLLTIGTSVPVTPEVEAPVAAYAEPEFVAPTVEADEDEVVDYTSGYTAEELFAPAEAVEEATEVSYEAPEASFDEDASDADPIVEADSGTNYGFGIPEESK